MQIEWLTVGAQIVNFLVLVYLLRRFLFRPVIQAMQARKALVSQRLQEADQREKEAIERSKVLDEQLHAFQAKQSQMLNEAQQRADAEYAQLLEQARTRVTNTEQRWRNELTREQSILMDEIRHTLSTAAGHIAARALEDLASVDLQNQIIEVLIRRLDEFDAPRLAPLTANSEHILISSAQDIATALRQRLDNTLQRHAERPLTIEYVLAPQLLCGIEIQGSSQLLSWNIRQFLDEVGAEIIANLETASNARTARDDAA